MLVFRFIVCVIKIRLVAAKLEGVQSLAILTLPRTLLPIRVSAIFEHNYSWISDIELLFRC